ncbi:M20/M25/M40 family metallo-hydrolase [Falsihalocynthiibacter arcticus]|uniref:M20/M25/M40 family metallo-hydrolase n=1 Tax=Falsihalocynthiibacter arcticus TaxID=1579316 RepID=UPI0009ED3B56
MFCDKLISHPVNTDGHAPRACFFIATSSHLDTVPLGSAPWTFPPHGGEISGGRLFGRGASDMKGGISKRKVLFTDNCQFQSVLDTPLQAPLFLYKSKLMITPSPTFGHSSTNYS